MNGQEASLDDGRRQGIAADRFVPFDDSYSGEVSFGTVEAARAIYEGLVATGTITVHEGDDAAGITMKVSRMEIYVEPDGEPPKLFRVYERPSA